MTFKICNDARFNEKLIDVVGLYLNPPDKAIVLCMDEKSSIQALDRTQPSLPIINGRAATITHDYKRHGTTTLFAALDVLAGKVIGSCLPKHRHSEFVRFLKTIDAEVHAGLQVHLILDNYATHKHPNVLAWLGKRPRFHLHFTPTSSSWLNLVERWFRELTEKALRREVFHSVPDLISAIEAYLDSLHNDDTEPSHVGPRPARAPPNDNPAPRTSSLPRGRSSPPSPPPTSSHSKLRTLLGWAAWRRHPRPRTSAQRWPTYFPAYAATSRRWSGSSR